MVTATATAAIQTIGIYQKQADFRHSPAWLRGFVGGRGTGKTRIGAIDLCLNMRDGESAMVVSPSYVVIAETTWPTFREVAEQLDVWISGVKSPTPRAKIRTSDGGEAEVVFRTGEVPEKLRGPSKAWLWIDEASVMHEDVWKIGIPVLRHRGRMGRCLMTFTPKGRRHWTFNAFFSKCEVPVNAEGVADLAALPEDVRQFGGAYYRPRDNTDLIHAHTLENPFLPPEFFDLVAQNYSVALAAQELGGEFVELEGLMFLRHNWRFVDSAPAIGVRVRYWDRAATLGAGAYTAGVLMCATPDGQYYVEDVVRGQWSAGERDRIIEETAIQDARKHDNQVVIYVEQEGGSGGKEVAAQMVKLLAGFPVYRDIVSGKRSRIVDKLELPGEAKIVRAMPLAAQVEAGNVFVVRAAWNESYLEELCAFPEFRYADQVDASSGAFNKLAARHTSDPGAVTRTETETNSERHGVRLEPNRERGRYRPNRR